MKQTMYLLLILLLSLVFSFTGRGQTPVEDVVYLKNGNIIRGTILEQIPDQSLKIQTKDNSLFVFTQEEIEKVTREATAAPEQNVTYKFAPSPTDTIYLGKKRKYYQNGHALTSKELSDLLKTNPKAYAFKKTADGYNTGGTILMCIGAGIIGSSAFITKNLTTTLIVGGIGLGFEVFGLLVNSGYRPNMKRAIAIYNQGINAKKQQTISINAGFTRSGLGISLNF